MKSTKSTKRKSNQSTVVFGSVTYDGSAQTRRKLSHTVRISEKSFDSDNETSIHDSDEEINAEESELDENGNEELEYGSTSRTVRTSDSASIVCPLDEDFFDVSAVLLSSETSEDTIEDIEDFKQLPLESQEDFFSNFGEVPDLRQISAESMGFSKRKSSAVLSQSSLHGKFVDPLTGMIFGDGSTGGDDRFSEEPGMEEELEEVDSSKIIAQDSGTAFEEFSFDDFDSRFPELVDKTVVIRESEEDLAILFAAHETHSEHSVVIVPTRRPTSASAAYEQTEKFLQDLINFVVRYCAHEQNTELLRKKLDKVALFREIKKISLEMDVERKVNYFLNKKCVEYHRRKGNMRHLLEEKSDRVLQELAAYKEKSEYLHTLLAKEWTMFKKIDRQISQLTAKVDEGEEKKRLEIVAFENLVRKTIKCNLNPVFEKLVSTQLRHMSTLREEISAARSVIIQRQHTLGTLRARLHELENLGDGLHLADYENLQREMQALGKKIEDRNRELGKMHNRFHHNLHSMAHIKLKNEVTVGNISEKVNNLQDLEIEEYLTRQRLFKMNLTHKSTRRQLQDLSLQSGLLDKPALLRDYDETMERVKVRRAKVQELKQSHHELEVKIKQLQVPANAPSANTNKSNADKSKSLKHKSANKSIIVGLEGICLNF